MENKIVNSKKSVTFYILLIIALINIFIVNSLNETEYIIINLEYKTGSDYDVDNDGIETTLGIIDFTVENTLFDITIFDVTINEENLCTIWEVYSVENEESTKVCYGNEKCCNFISLIPTRSDWKETFYLSYGLYGASYNNVVSAQVIHVDYNLSLGNPYSNIYYSEWGSLSAIFREENSVMSMNSLLDNENSIINLSIISPDNSTALQSGEGIYLNFTTNVTVNANYSLDSDVYTNLGEGASFYDLLIGTLQYNILENSKHNILINVEDDFENSLLINYSFIIGDISAPIISINITNNSIFSTEYFELPISITSDEYASISHKINNNEFSSLIDLGWDKTTTIELYPESGQNILLINASDLHNNHQVYYYSFEFNEIANCSDAKQNGDETGIDCGGSCSACIEFNVTLNEYSYNLTDNVYITVMSRANSLVNLTVYKESEVSYHHIFTPVFLGAPIGEINLIENTSNAGNYTINAIMYYLNITEEKNLTFEVLAPSNNPLSVTINANATTIDESDTVYFSASISGNSGSVTYKWDFENDGTIDSTSESATKKYNSNGTYTINLTISDNLWSQSDIETITVKKLYNVTFFVKDNSTKNVIENAEVKFGSILKNTSTDGKAKFTIAEGDHDVRVEKSGYKTFSRRIDVNKNEDVVINLTEKDDVAPKIELISPNNGQVVVSRNVTLKYKAVDKSDMTCRLYYTFSGFNFQGVIIENNSIKSDIENEFQVKVLTNGTYKWKVDCIDRHGNINSSATREFILNEDALFNELSVNLEEQDKSTEDIVSQIEEIIESLKDLGSEEKEVAEAMQLKKVLEKAITSIERSNRDLHSLKWRKLNDTDLEEETKKILDGVENVKDKTPRSFEIIESTEFVKYPNKKDIETAISILLNQTNLKLRKKDLVRLVDKNDELQSLITVTTKARIISLEYLSGNKKIITLIQKIVNSNSNLSNVKFYEMIPKDIAEDVDEIEFLFDYETIERDPVIEIDINKIKDYVYLVNKSFSLESSEKTKSILLSKNLRAEEKSLITGLAVFDNLTSKIVEGGNKRLIIEIIIIIILAAIYIVYSFGGVEHFKIMLDGKEIKEINALINSALEDINKNSYENSSSKYKEVNSKFNKLEKKKRDMIRSSVIELANKVNLLYVNKLVDEAMNNIKSDKKNALSTYIKIQSLYKVFPKQYKAEVSKKCLVLHKELNS